MTEDERKKNTLFIAACLIAAVRTAREEKILPTAPRIVSRVHDSVTLARMVLERIERGG